MAAECISRIGSPERSSTISRHSRWSGYRRNAQPQGPDLEPDPEGESDANKENEFTLLDPEVRGILAQINVTACGLVAERLQQLWSK